MRLRVSLFASAALLITGAAFAQTPVANNTKMFQPDNQAAIVGSGGTRIANPGPGSSFQVNYATNFNLSAQSVKVMNTGSAGGVDGGGTICVNVYVFDNAQNFQDCCYCKVSPNGLGTIPLNGNFNAPTTMVIKLVATYPNDYQPQSSSATSNVNTAQPTGTTTNTCNAALPATGIDPTDTSGHASGTAQGVGSGFNSTPSPYSGGQQYLAPGLAAWLDTTPFQNPVRAQLEFHQSTFSVGEAASLAYQCGQKHGGIVGTGNTLTSQCPASVCQ